MSKPPKYIASWQIRLIHVAANQLNLISRDRSETDPGKPVEDPYRQILSGFIGSNGQPAVSSKNLNYDQANILIEIFHKLGFKSTGPRTNQFESLFSKDRPDEMATIKQLGLIMGVWVQHSREKTFDSLNTFTKRIVGIDRLEWIHKNHVTKMIEAIKNL